MSQGWKKILAVFLGVVIFIGVMDFPYFWIYLNYFLSGISRNRPTASNIDSNSSTSVLFQRDGPDSVRQGQDLAHKNLDKNTLLIESLGIQVPIIYAQENSEKTFQAALIDGVVHFPNTAKPGELGNCYIFGHSSDYIWAAGKYKTVFALLPEIKRNSEILISNEAGQTFVYYVQDSFVASAQDVRWLDQGNYQKKILTLQTSYPLGTALKRYIVIAEMR